MPPSSKSTMGWNTAERSRRVIRSSMLGAGEPRGERTDMSGCRNDGVVGLTARAREKLSDLLVKRCTGVVPAGAVAWRAGVLCHPARQTARRLRREIARKPHEAASVDHIHVQ